MNDLDLCYLPGHRALDLFRQGKLSPVEVVQAQISQAEKIGDKVNAFTDTYFDEAIQQAKAAEQRFMRTGGRPRALEGLTLGIKDHQDVAGKRSTHACLAYRDNVATTTNAACQRLLDAGAILIAKTTTPEFCSAGVTYSKLFGATGTPWNPHYTAGGSSGGSAAALAAGLVTLATGSDIAGSIRVPAACCGVVGYKPPYGRIPGTVPFNLDFYCQTGPLARSVGDCAAMTNIMSGVHPCDIATVREEINLPAQFEPVSGWRVALSRDLGFAAIAREVDDGLTRTADRLRALGITVDEVDLGWGDEVTTAAVAYLDHLFGRELERNLERFGDRLCDYNIHYAGKAGSADAEAYLSSFQTAAAMYDDIAPLLENYDALICPTVGTHEVRAEAKPWETIRVGGREIDTDFGWVLTHPFNMLSRLPVLAIPNGIASNGLPTGIQIVARSFDDHRVFRLAHALEKQSPWLDCVERRPSFGDNGDPFWNDPGSP